MCYDTGMNTRFYAVSRTQLGQLAACLKRDFPPNELISLGNLPSLYESGFYRCWALEADEPPLAAYAICAIQPDHGWVLLIYLAVDPALRDRGLGGAMMEHLKQQYSENAGIIVEAELPGAAKDAAELVLRNRRFAFYFSHGARVLLDEGYYLYGVDFSVLSIPMHPENQHIVLGDLMRSWYRAALPPQEMRNVRFSPNAELLKVE